MSGLNDPMLQEAIARNAGAVLSLPSAGLLRHHKSRFLNAGGEGFWIQSVPAERGLILDLIASGQPSGLSFKSGHVKGIFTTSIHRWEPHYRVNPTTRVEALLLRYPQAIQAIQRRSNYRVAVSADAGITARIWRMGPQADLHEDPTMSAQEIRAEVRDISLGGIGVTLSGPDGQPPRVSNEDRLRIELQISEITLLIEGQLRHPTRPIEEPSVRAGIQFKTLEHDFEGRKTLSALTRIVGELQRSEVRRYRQETNAHR